MVKQVVNVPLGYRFNPEAHELVQHYLKPKILNQPMYMDIPEVEIYSNDPRSSPEILLDELPPIVGEPYDNEWFFFTNLKGKHGVDSKHTDRVCGGGSWKVSNAKKEIYSMENGSDTKEVIGYKTILTYHVGKKKFGDWIMYEYQMNNDNSTFVQEKKNNNVISAATAIDGKNKIKEIVLCHIHIKPSATAAAKKKKENSSKEENCGYDNVVRAAPEIYHHIDFNVQASSSLNPNLVEAGRISNDQEQEQDKEEEDDLQELGLELENYIIVGDDNDQNIGIIGNTKDADLDDFSQNLENDLILDGDAENLNINAVLDDAGFWSYLDGLPDFPPIEEELRDSYPTADYQDNDVHAQEENSNPADPVNGYNNGDFHPDCEYNVHSSGAQNEDNNGISVEEDEKLNDWSLINDDLDDILPDNNNGDLLDLTLRDFDLAEFEEDQSQLSADDNNVDITRKRTRNDTEEDDQAANKKTKY